MIHALRHANVTTDVVGHHVGLIVFLSFTFVFMTLQTAAGRWNRTL